MSLNIVATGTTTARVLVNGKSIATVAQIPGSTRWANSLTDVTSSSRIGAAQMASRAL